MAVLTCRNLTKRFGGLTAVNSVNFEARPGEILAIIGPNGAGKTTIFSLVTGFLTPDAGSLELDGKALDGYSPEQRCWEGLVRTFQIVQPFRSLSVLENVVMGAMLRANSLAKARIAALEVLHMTGMEHLAANSAGTLPIGDRKRLEVAKAIATKPSVILLDEVTGGLIPVEVNKMINLLRNLRDQGMALVVIEHNMSAVMQLADRIVVLCNGECIAEGTPAEVSRNPTVLTAYLGENFKAVGAQ